MSNAWPLRGIKKILLDKRLSKPRLKNRSYQLKVRSWMRRLSAADNRIETLESDKDELVKSLQSLLVEYIDTHEALNSYRVDNLEEEYCLELPVTDAQKLINRIKG